MGFFNKLFGGDKKKSGEIEVVEDDDVVKEKKKKKEKKVEEQVEVVKEEPQKVEKKAEEQVEKRAEEQVEEATEEPRERAPKATVFGMAAPPVASPDADQQSTSGELRSVSGELGAPADDAPRVVSGELGGPAHESEDDEEAGVPEDEAVADETEQMESPDSADDAGVPDDQPKSVLNILRGTNFEDDDLFGGGSGKIVPKESKQVQLSNHIECENCSRRLPVPFQGYPAKITCPFCLSVNEYQA